VELQKKDEEKKINNENPELRSKGFLHKVNTIYLFLKKHNVYPATNTASTSRDSKRVLKIDEL